MGIPMPLTKEQAPAELHKIYDQLQRDIGKIPNIFGVPWLISRGYGKDFALSVASVYDVFLNVLGMAGIICLIYAFWVKFKERHVEAIPEIAQ